MLNDGERLDVLFRENMKIIQSKNVFSFSKDALILADFTRILKRDKTIIDLCSGNGIIPLLLSHRTSLPIDGVEIQPLVISMANRSITLNGKSDQITMVEGDIKNIKALYTHSTFDVITVNPPYFTINTPGKFNDAHRIARHEVHIDLEGIIRASKYLVKNRGRLYMIHKASRSAEILYQLMRHGFGVSRIKYVYNDPSKETALFILIEAVFNSSAETKVMPPLYIFNQNEYSKEMMRIYYG